MALGALAICWRDSSLKAYNMLGKHLPDFNNKTVIEIAHDAGYIHFLAHPCCQKWLTKTFLGHLQIKELDWGLFRLPYWFKVSHDLCQACLIWGSAWFVCVYVSVISWTWTCYHWWPHLFPMMFTWWYKFLSFSEKKKKSSCNTVLIDIVNIIVFCHICLFVCLSISQFVCFSTKSFTTDHNFWMVSHRAFIFHMCIPYGRPFIFAPRSRSWVLSPGRISRSYFAKKWLSHGHICLVGYFCFFIVATGCPSERRP